MDLPVLSFKQQYRRGRFIFIILSLSHSNKYPFVTDGNHRIRTNKLLTPSGATIKEPSLGAIEQFGDITEHSYIEVIYKIDIHQPIFAEQGNYILYVGQVIEGRRWGNLIEVVINKP